MGYTILILAVVLLMLAAERLVVLGATRSPRCQNFIRHCWLLHPNGISILRFPQGIAAIALADSNHWPLAILWFAFWMITDLTDGTIARTCDLVTETGKWLDPLSDKLMSFPALLYLAIGENVTSPRLRLWMVAAYCAVDAVGQFSRLFCKKTAANSFGKVKTAMVTVLIAILAIYQLRCPDIPLFKQATIDAMMLSCLILACLSLYCKVVPDNWYANSLTFLNFACGLGAIWIAWHPEYPSSYIFSFLLIFAGQFFDLFDGKMARKFGSTKRGALYDDIADGTSFGLAVGSMIFLGLTRIDDSLPSVLSALIAIFYIACIFWRLYRFIHPTRNMPPGVFQGLPSPAGALLAGSGILACVQYSGMHFTVIAAACAVLSGILMISNIPYRHFGQNLWPSVPRGLRLLFLIALIVIICLAIDYKDWETAFSWTMTLLALTYAAFAIALPRQSQKTHGATH